MKQTAFQRVANMNESFGNAKGDSKNIDWQRVRSQCKNVLDEYLELMSALGLAKDNIAAIRTVHNANIASQCFVGEPVVEGVRDALCDIQVFGNGAQHLMGYDGDRDMDDVIDGVMSRFVKDAEDKVQTMALHAAKGVTQVYFEGEYPAMVMKSAVDQPDAPMGKFMKSASFKQPIFRDAP